jgi:hypothetical protein
MTSPRFPLSALRAAAAALGLVVASAGSLAAQGRTLFAWSGRVDREVLLVMRGGNVNTRQSSRDDYGRVRVGSQLPRTDGVVQLQVQRGRGSADVVQQPNARNDFTAVVRLRDDQTGTGDYQVAAFWQPVNGGYAGSDDGRYDRGDDRRGNNGGGWGRGGRRDRDDRARDDRNRDDRNRDDRNRDDRNRDDRNRDDRNRDDRSRDDGGYGGTTNGNSPWDVIRGRTSGSTGGSGTSGVLRWSGRVDDVQEIRIRGRRTDSFAVSGGGASGVRSSVSGALPTRDVYVRVRQLDGRGRVRVVEQPSARNDYTAVLRVEDRDGGAGFYNFEASW